LWVAVEAVAGSAVMQVKSRLLMATTVRSQDLFSVAVML